MDVAKLIALLESVAAGELAAPEAVERLRSLPYEDLGFAKIDHHRALRKGYPETIYCAGKTVDQVCGIVDSMHAHGSNILGTRCTPEMAEAVAARHPETRKHDAARAFSILVDPPPELDGYVAVVAAGTSDIPVAEEAALAAEMMGSRIERCYDVGVAGLHRLLGQREMLHEATALVVCAGMEGALPSVVAGLVNAPVIGVPTSVGYGASFNGVAALLGMLNSCATGLTVTNIDNGFSGGVAAATIHRIANGVAG